MFVCFLKVDLTRLSIRMRFFKRYLATEAGRCSDPLSEPFTIRMRLIVFVCHDLATFCTSAMSMVVIIGCQLVSFILLATQSTSWEQANLSRPFNLLHVLLINRRFEVYVHDTSIFKFEQSTCISKQSTSPPKRNWPL